MDIEAHTNQIHMTVMWKLVPLEYPVCTLQTNISKGVMAKCPGKQICMKAWRCAVAKWLFQAYSPV